MVAGGRARAALRPLAAGLLLCVGATASQAHPLHTTLGELTFQPDTREVDVEIRVFEDDFNDAVARAPRPTNGADPRVAYLTTRFVLRDAEGRFVRLRWTEARRSADLLWIRMQGRAPAGIRGGTLRHDLIVDLHADQVNVIRARYPGADRTLLFTRGAGAKPLP